MAVSIVGDKNTTEGGYGGCKIGWKVRNGYYLRTIAIPGATWGAYNCTDLALTVLSSLPLMPGPALGSLPGMLRPPQGFCVGTEQGLSLSLSHLRKSGIPAQVSSSRAPLHRRLRHSFLKQGSERVFGRFAFCGAGFSCCCLWRCCFSLLRGLTSGSTVLLEQASPPGGRHPDKAWVRLDLRQLPLVSREGVHPFLCQEGFERLLRVDLNCRGDGISPIRLRSMRRLLLPLFARGLVCFLDIFFSERNILIIVKVAACGTTSALACLGSPAKLRRNHRPCRACPLQHCRLGWI